jgi:quercetin dioxygenase-like cupin family protein
MTESWPDELDALTAAPEHHMLLLENHEVRVLETRIAPGGTTPLHTHRWPAALYVFSGDDFVRRDADGNVLVDTRGTEMNGPAFWSAPLPPHTLENVGAAAIRVVSVELKRA